LYCYSNCSGHGKCIPSSYFQFGTCNCNQGYLGFDCSIEQVATTPQNTHQPTVYSGTMCAFYGVQFAILQLSILILISCFSSSVCWFLLFVIF
jgi:hypothetical protein